MTQLVTLQHWWKQALLPYHQSVWVTHIKHTWQEDTMLKIFQDYFFWHRFTFTCHNISVFPHLEKPEWKPTKMTTSLGYVCSCPHWDARDLMNLTLMGQLLSKDFPHFHHARGTTTLHNYPPSIWTYFCILYVSPHPSINCITIIQKNNQIIIAEHFIPTLGIYSKAIKIGLPPTLTEISSGGF